MSGNYQGFTRMKEKGLSLAAFAITVLFLILTVIMVTVTLQSAYAWLVMGSTLFLFVTLCSYSSCQKTNWQRTAMHSDSISTVSDGHDSVMVGEHNRSILPYWITDLPPSYAAATSQQAENVTGRISPYVPPPPYTMAVEPSTDGQSSSTASSGESQSARQQHQHQNGNIRVHTPDTLTLHQPHPYRVPINSLQDCGPPEHTHSLKIPSNAVRLLPPDCKHNDTHSLDRHLAERRIKETTDDSSSVC